MLHKYVMVSPSFTYKDYDLLMCKLCDNIIMNLKKKKWLFAQFGRSNN